MVGGGAGPTKRRVGEGWPEAEEPDQRPARNAHDRRRVLGQAPGLQGGDAVTPTPPTIHVTRCQQVTITGCESGSTQVKIEDCAQVAIQIQPRAEATQNGPQPAESELDRAIAACAEGEAAVREVRNHLAAQNERIQRMGEDLHLWPPAQGGVPPVDPVDIPEYADTEYDNASSDGRQSETENAAARQVRVRHVHAEGVSDAIVRARELDA